MDAPPLVSLSEPASVRAEWTVYVGDDAPRHVPADLRREWRYVRHVCVCGPFGVSFWWQARNEPRGKWLFVRETG